MSIGRISTTALTDIADAIRSKNGTQNTYTPSQMPQAILDIPNGPKEYKHVTFIDYDGEVVAAYTLQEALALTSTPTPPSHLNDELPLQFSGYNWTLQEVQDQLTAHPELPIIAGALYTSTDTYSHALYTIDDYRVRVCVNFDPTPSGVTIDWGDGSSSSVNTNAMYHTYSSNGEYHVKVSQSSNGYNIGFAYNIGYENLRMPRKVSFSSSVNGLTSFGFCYANELEAIPLTPDCPISLAYFSTYDLVNLKALVIPKNSEASMGTNQKPKLYSAEVISFPPSITGTYLILMRCFNLKHLALPYIYPSTVSDICNTEIESIVIPGSISALTGWNWQTNNASKIKKIVVSEGVTSCNSSFFSYVYSLEELYLPSTITNIGNIRGSMCTIWCYAQTPPAFTGMISSKNESPVKIYVPYGCGEAYKAAWASWANRIYEMPQA